MYTPRNKGVRNRTAIARMAMLAMTTQFMGVRPRLPAATRDISATKARSKGEGGKLTRTVRNRPRLHLSVIHFGLGKTKMAFCTG